MKHRRKLRRGAILALVLVMLCNAIPARANTTEQAESPQGSPNWVEVVTMILLAVLVLGELRDKWKSRT